MSPDNREIVLKHANSRPTSRFLSILKQHGLTGACPARDLTADGTTWESKYTKLKEKYEALVAENNELKKTVKNMKKILS